MTSPDEEFDIDIDDEDNEDATEILNVDHLNLGDLHSDLLDSTDASNSAPTPEEFERFGHYRLLGKVGGNESVEVWVVGDETDGGTCVLKRIPFPRESRTEVAILSDEIRVSEALHHPNIVESISSGIIDGMPYISMELVDGMSLTDLNGIMGRSQRPPGAVLDLGIQIAEALAYLHDGACDDQARPLDLIHGNLRPHNVFVTREGFVKLGEVGLSFPMASAALEKKVKLPYLAPEQFGRHPIDARSDIYALGVILIELLSGQLLAPFGALALHDAKAWQVDLKQSLSPDLGDYLSSMISSSCHGRPQTAVQVARDLRRFFQRFGAGQSLATYVAEHVFENVPTMEAAEAIDIQALQRRCAESVTDGGSGVTVLPDDALEELSYPSTVSLIIDDIDWDAIDEVDEDKYAGSIKVLNPIMDTQDLLPSNAELSQSNELDDRPRTLRLGDEGRRIIAQDPAFRRALGLKTAKAVEDRKEWDYYLVAGDELGARIIQKNLTSARPYQDQVVVFLKGSDLLAGFDLEADAQPLEHGSVWAGDDSGYGESSSPAQDPSYLRYHERVLVRSAPRRGTSVRGRVLRFLGK